MPILGQYNVFILVPVVEFVGKPPEMKTECVFKSVYLCLTAVHGYTHTHTHTHTHIHTHIRCVRVEAGEVTELQTAAESSDVEIH